MSQFSRQTVIAAVNILDLHMTQAETTQFLLELDRKVYEVAPEDRSVRKRMNALILYTDDNPEHRVNSGVAIEEAIIKQAISILRARKENKPPSWLQEPLETFRRSLKQDGFSFDSGALRAVLPTDIDLPSIKSELVHLLDHYEFAMAPEHLEQALDAHADGKWASANSQFRTFLEALLDEIAIKLEPSAHELDSGEPRRKKLAELDFLKTQINEWRYDGRGFINGLFKRLHSDGAHPGPSDEDESTFRLHVVLLTAGLLMRRFHNGHGS